MDLHERVTDVQLTSVSTLPCRNDSAACATAAFRLHSAESASAGHAAGCSSLLPEPCGSHTARIWGTQRPYQQYSGCIVGFSCVAPVGAQHQLPERVHALAHFRQLLLPASAAAAATRGGGGGCAGSSHGRVCSGAGEELGARNIQSSLLTGQRCLWTTSTAVNKNRRSLLDELVDQSAVGYCLQVAEAGRRTIASARQRRRLRPSFRLPLDRSMQLSGKRCRQAAQAGRRVTTQARQQ